MNVLDTERLQLRWLEVDTDAAFIYQLMNQPSFVRYIGDRGIRTLDDARGYIERIRRDDYQQRGFGMYLTALKDTGVAIGICGLLQREGMDDVEIGFALRPAYWSQGYAYEAASAVMAYGQREFGLTRIAAVTTPDNHASKRLLARLGMHEAGFFYPDGHPNGGDRNDDADGNDDDGADSNDDDGAGGNDGADGNDRRELQLLLWKRV